jgi:antitoxin component YwqK of YwqJK toxin-antitoxin module
MFENSEPCGVWRVFSFSNMLKQTISFYDKGNRAIIETFWANGQPKLNYSCMIDSSGAFIRDGVCIFYNHQGMLKSYSEFKFGQLNGVMKKYFATTPPSVKEIGEYKNGVRIGTWREYFPNGNLKEMGKYAEISGQPMPNTTEEFEGDFEPDVSSSRFIKTGRWASFSVDGKTVEYFQY